MDAAGSFPVVAGTDAGRGRQFVGFHLADQTYVFPIERIQEIVIPSATARVPEVPDYVEGVANLRGTIIPIINLRRLFGLDPKPADAETRTVQGYRILIALFSSENSFEDIIAPSCFESLASNGAFLH
jgi:chemotaxis signal transduction protein